MSPASNESLSIPAAGEGNLHDMEAASELCGMHPEMILEFCRARVVTIHLRGAAAVPHVDDRGIHRLRQIETLRRQRTMSLHAIRLVMELSDRLETAEQELRLLRERLR